MCQPRHMAYDWMRSVRYTMDSYWAAHGQTGQLSVTGGGSEESVT